MKKKYLSFICIGVIGLLFSSCATIFSGSKQRINFDSAPQGAKVVNNGKTIGTTPFTAKIKRKSTTSYTFSKENYQDENVVEQGRFNPTVIANVLGGLSGGIGVGIDYATGAAWKYKNKSVYTQLDPMGLYTMPVQQQDAIPTYSQRFEAVSAPFKLKVENKEDILRQLQEDNKKFQELWQQELDLKRAALAGSQKISDAIQIDVKPTVALALAEDGAQNMDLTVTFAYATIAQDKNKEIRLSASSKTDDYPSGAYNPSLSNACKLTLEFIKSKVETELAKYMTPGARVTIKITGETDGSPINSKLPYKGEYGDFSEKLIYTNGELNNITVTQETGITSNAQLAFLRTQGVEDFMKTYITPLHQTRNNYQIYAVENKERGDEYRRISIEMIIHGAFNDEMNKKLNVEPEPQMAESFISDIDRNIPTSNKQNEDFFALIIANENYGDMVPDVPFAVNDGKSMATYCEKTLGIPKRQILYVENGTYNKIQNGIDQLTSLLKAAGHEGKAIVYYAGHGIPNAETNSAYIIPTDANPTKTNQLISLNAMYSAFGAVQGSVLVVLDACFSGTRRNGEMILEGTRAVKIKAKEEPVKGNTVVISATDGYQTAQPLREEKHGLFTYYFLKTLQQSNGDILLGEWFEKTRKIVSKEALLKSMEQTPTITVSSALEDEWNNIKF